MDLDAADQSAASFTIGIGGLDNAEARAAELVSMYAVPGPVRLGHSGHGAGQALAGLSLLRGGMAGSVAADGSGDARDDGGCQDPASGYQGVGEPLGRAGGSVGAPEPERPDRDQQVENVDEGINGGSGAPCTMLGRSMLNTAVPTASSVASHNAASQGR